MKWPIKSKLKDKYTCTAGPVANKRKVTLETLTGRNGGCGSFPTSDTETDDDPKPTSSLPPPPPPPGAGYDHPKIKCTKELRKGIDKTKSAENAEIWCRCNANGDTMAKEDDCHNPGGGKGEFCKWRLYKG